MHVAIIGECPWLASSLAKITLHMTRGLIEEGYRVSVSCRATMFPIGSITQVFNPYKWSGSGPFGTPEWDIDIRVFPYYTSVIALATLIKRLLPDAVIIYGTPYGGTEVETLSVIPSNIKIPVVLYALDDGVDELAGPPDPIMFSSIAVFPSIDVKRRYVEAIKRKFGYDISSRTHVAYHGYDPETWSPSWTLPVPKTIDFIFYSKNHVRKDFEAYLRASYRVSEKLGRSITMAIYPLGDGPWNISAMRAMLPEIDSAIGRGKLVLVQAEEPWSKIGLFEEQIMYMMATSRAGVFSTIGEAFGLVALEMALLSIPFVVTDIPVIRELWGEVLPNGMMAKCVSGNYIIGAPIRLCRPDPESLAESMELSLSAEEVGWKLREYASKRYHYKNMSREIAKAIEKAQEDPTRLGEIMIKRPELRPSRSA